MRNQNIKGKLRLKKKKKWGSNDGKVRKMVKGSDASIHDDGEREIWK